MLHTVYFYVIDELMIEELLKKYNITVQQLAEITGQSVGTVRHKVKAYEGQRSTFGKRECAALVLWNLVPPDQKEKVTTQIEELLKEIPEH